MRESRLASYQDSARPMAPQRARQGGSEEEGGVAAMAPRQLPWRSNGMWVVISCTGPTVHCRVGPSLHCTIPTLHYPYTVPSLHCTIPTLYYPYSTIPTLYHSYTALSLQSPGPSIAATLDLAVTPQTSAQSQYDFSILIFCVIFCLSTFGHICPYFPFPWQETRCGYQ